MAQLLFRELLLVGCIGSHRRLRQWTVDVAGLLLRGIAFDLCRRSRDHDDAWFDVAHSASLLWFRSSNGQQLRSLSTHVDLFRSRIRKRNSL